MGNFWGRRDEPGGAAWPRRLLLARHGATDWNADHRWQGHRDIPLNERGRAQARALARRVADEAVDAVWTSDLSRARETAEAICAARHLEPTVHADLREIDVGAWEGLRFEDIRRAHPEVVEALARGADLPRGGTGERVSEFQARVVAGFERAAADAPSGTLLLVVHGGVVKALVGHLLGVPAGNIGRITSGQNASLSEIRFGEYGPQLVRLNESHHADGIADIPPVDSA